MKKNGFTFLELMGIMVVLAIIMLLAVPSISKTLKNTDTNKDASAKETACLAAKAYLLSVSNNGDIEDKVVKGKIIFMTYVADDLTIAGKTIDKYKITYKSTGCIFELN